MGTFYLKNKEKLLNYLKSYDIIVVNKIGGRK